MIRDRGNLNGHEKFNELCALAMSGTLTPDEWAELKDHLQTCGECREAYSEYVILTKEGIPLLASRYSRPEEEGNWNDAATRKKLFARVAFAQLPKIVAQATHRAIPATKIHVPRRIAANPLVVGAVAACIVCMVAVGAYRYGQRTEAAAKRAVASATASAEDRIQKLTAEKKAVDDLLSIQGEKLAKLKAESSQKQSEIERLRSELNALESRANELTASKAASDEQLRAVLQQRDAVAGQLQDARHAYDTFQAQLAGLKEERDRAVVRLASLQSEVEVLSATNRDQQQRLDRAEQFLASDRDIRELMGARNLYIADVFDVDSSSRTRKPFGRVFYTQGKSLIFYAFDLDRQPGLKNASAFQAWGQKETAQGEKAQPVNLGILYVDNETNRRWALHCEDPKQLAEIDAVFVTVEPHGGSQKPTGKPFLYAMLRKEANHP